jgi:hypothetical protein
VADPAIAAGRGYSAWPLVADPEPRQGPLVAVPAFVRGETFNVYPHPERVGFNPEGQRPKTKGAPRRRFPAEPDRSLG